MHLFFAQHHNISDDLIVLDGTDYNHIKNVLRLKPGSSIQIKSGDNKTYYCTVKEFEDDRVLCEISEVVLQDTELPVNVTIFQGLPKAEKMETVIQKTIELGAVRIVPVAMERSITKLDEKKAENKLKRWRSIAQAAAQQSKRSLVPEVSDVCDFKDALKQAAECDKILMPYECAEGFGYTREILDNIKPGESIAVFIGPEGGISSGELEAANDAGADVISLGKRILRTETAALMLMSVMIYLFE